MKLEITKERILAAAAKCSTAKQTLQTLFPEAFEDDKSVTISDEATIIRDKDGILIACMRDSGEYSGKAILLDKSLNWELKIDSENCFCLIPTKK